MSFFRKLKLNHINMVFKKIFLNGCLYTIKLLNAIQKIRIDFVSSNIFFPSKWQFLGVELFLKFFFFLNNPTLSTISKTIVKGIFCYKHRRICSKKNSRTSFDNILCFPSATMIHFFMELAILLTLE